MSYILSSNPGRIRLRHPLLCNSERLSRLQERLAHIEHVSITSTNPRIGSIVLSFDAAKVDVVQVEAAVDAANDAELATPVAAPARVARRHRRPLRLEVNRYAKLGMLTSLGTSLVLAGAGKKRWHAAAGAGFVVCLGLHLSTHYRHLLR